MKAKGRGGRRGEREISSKRAGSGSGPDGWRAPPGSVKGVVAVFDEAASAEDVRRIVETVVRPDVDSNAPPLFTF